MPDHTFIEHLSSSKGSIAGVDEDEKVASPSHIAFFCKAHVRDITLRLILLNTFMGLFVLNRKPYGPGSILQSTKRTSLCFLNI